MASPSKIGPGSQRGRPPRDADAIGLAATELAYVNGVVLPRARAVVPIEDRGLLMADAVYEVVAIHAGRPFAVDEHVTRMRRSRAETGIAEPPGIDRFDAVLAELLAAGRPTDGKVYWQVGRGAGPRSFLPDPALRPTEFMLVDPAPPLRTPGDPDRWAAVMLPDMRWRRPDIKTTMLAPAVHARIEAARRHADVAILERDGFVTEATAQNVLVVTDGLIRSHPVQSGVLPGVTLAMVRQLAEEAGIPWIDQPAEVRELAVADEVLVTGTTASVTAITAIDGEPVGGGDPGPITCELHRRLVRRILNATAEAGDTGGV